MILLWEIVYISHFESFLSYIQYEDVEVFFNEHILPKPQKKASPFIRQHPLKIISIKNSPSSRCALFLKLVAQIGRPAGPLISLLPNEGNIAK